MKRRKNIIISAITCMFSICLMMFGVYAAASPTITLSGQVSYTVRDAKVLVLGKVNGQSGEDQTNKIAYPTVADMTNPTESEKVTESTTQYMSFTKGDGNSETDQLDAWDLQTHTFYEDNTGIRPITISMKLSNLSNYPVLATVAYTVSDATLATSNLTRTTTGMSESTVYLPMSSTKEISITYDVLDDSTSVSGTNLVGMTVTFAKTVEPTASNAYYTNAEGTSQELTLSDWEYVFEGDSYTITKYVGDLTSVGENLYIPSSITTSDNKTYPVKALGAVDMTFEELMNSGDESDWFGYSILHDKDTISALVASEDVQTALNAYIATLPTVIVPEGIEKINACALFSVPIQSLPTSIKSVGVLGVCDYVVEVAEFGITVIEIETLNLPNVESIDAGAFAYNTNLTSVTLGDKLESIGDMAFLYCFGLTSVIIPSSVTSIEDSAFIACSSLTTVQVNRTTPCECGSTIFGFVSNLASGFTIYVPNESYKTADGWSTYADFMVVGTAPEQSELKEWEFEIEEDGTATLTKYNGNLNKSTLTIPATVDYEGTTYNVKRVGKAYSETDDFLVFHKKSGEAAEVADYNIYTAIIMTCLGRNASELDFSEAGVSVPKFKKVKIESGIEYLGAGLFAGCTALQSVSISETVTNIDGGVFLACYGLTSINVDESNTAYTSASGSNCLIEISSGTLIQGCNNSVIPTNGSIKSISDYAFSFCSGLKNITIPEGVTSIGLGAFHGCSGLTGTLTIPNTVTTIKEDAFSDCSGFTGTLTIPNSVTTIKMAAFYKCSNITSLYVGDGLTYVDDEAFHSFTKLKSVTWANGDMLTQGLFYYNSNIEEITILSGSVNTSKMNTTSLKSVTLGKDVTSVSGSFPSVVTTVTFEGETPPTIESGIFDNCSNLTAIYVPSGSVEAYKAVSNLSSYADKIKAIA